MAWFTRLTRFGDVHAVYGQERGVSCGVACVIMAAFKINKLNSVIGGPPGLFSEADILKMAEEVGIPKGAGKSTGLTPGMMEKLLNHPALGMTGWEIMGNWGMAMPSEIIQKVGIASGVGPVFSVKPIIVDIKWTNEVSGHYVLIDTVRTFLGKTYATVCDPWDANVHIIRLEEGAFIEEEGIPVLNDKYKGATPAVGANFWGKRPMGQYPPTGVEATFSGTFFWRPEF